MSSRALRRLQKDSTIGLDLPCDENDEENDEAEDSAENMVPSRLKKKKKGRNLEALLNPFELLDNGTEEFSNDNDREEDSDCDDKKEPSVQRTTPTTKKKKVKKKHNGNERHAIVKEDEKETEDEVEASVQEVNRILGEASFAGIQSERGNEASATKMKPLLHIDYRNLNPETELKRMFGSQVVRGEQQQDRHRRQRNRPLQRSSKLVQPKDNWHPTGGSGLSMQHHGVNQGFAFEHSTAYQMLQFEFCDGVESGHPEAIINVLRKHPYHIDSLLQMSDFHRINEDFQTSAEFIEKALYGMECAFHPMFNMAAGNCYLRYDIPENRAFYLCLFKHILNLGRRGCNRTAFEFCKLLLSLDPSDDPLDCMSMLDFYALRSEQYEYLLRLETEALSRDAAKRVPNFAFSLALARFKDSLKKGEDTRSADSMLQDALLFFPVMLSPLLDQCSVQPDRRVSSHPFFNSKELLDNKSELERLVTLYVKRCETCWKEAAVMGWLERNVLAVLDIVDGGVDTRIQEYAELRRKGFKKPPLSLLRHYLLSEIPGVTPPQRFTRGPVLSHDPFPPPHSIISYIRPQRPRATSENSSNILRSFFASLRPLYNPNEPPELRNLRQAARNDLEEGEDEQEGAAGGPRAIPARIQESVNAIMNAMRQLLADPSAYVVPMPVPAGDGQEEGQGGENDEEWEDGDERR